MKNSVTRGIICMDGPLNLTYDVCIITYTVRSNGEFKYVFEPIYDVIDLLEEPDFQGIPGLDLSLRKKRYTRENHTPAFIEERSPAPNREGLWELLGEQGMDYLNRLEWLIRSNYRYAGDNLYVRHADETPAIDRVEESKLIATSQTMEQAMKKLLASLARGDTIIAKTGEPASKQARKALHDTLMLLLEKREGYRRIMRSEGTGGAPGRHRIPVEETRFDQALRDIENGALTAEAAAKRLGISRATFFRRKREWEDERANPSHSS